MAEDVVPDPTAPGWKRDPSGRFVGRYWDGQAWTGHVVSADRVRSLDAVPQQPRRPALLAPPPPAAARRRVPRWAIVAFPLAVAIGAAAFAITQNTANDSPGNTKAPAGQAARTGDFEVVVRGFKDPQLTSRYFPARPEMHYVSVDVEVLNRGSAKQSFSSFATFRLLDATGTEYGGTVADLEPGPPLGDIRAGGSLRGLALFEVPNGTVGLRLRAQAGGSAPAVVLPLG